MEDEKIGPTLLSPLQLSVAEELFGLKKKNRLKRKRKSNIGVIEEKKVKYLDWN